MTDHTRVARTVASYCYGHSFGADGGIELTLAIVGDVVRATDSPLSAAVADRFETLTIVEVVANSTLQVVTTSTVQAIRYDLTVSDRQTSSTSRQTSSDSSRSCFVQTDRSPTAILIHRISLRFLHRCRGSTFLVCISVYLSTACVSVYVHDEKKYIAKFLYHT